MFPRMKNYLPREISALVHGSLRCLRVLRSNIYFRHSKIPFYGEIKIFVQFYFLNL